MEERVAAGAQRMSELGRLTRGGGVSGRIPEEPSSRRRFRPCVGKGITGVVGAECGVGRRYRGCGKIEGMGSLKRYCGILSMHQVTKSGLGLFPSEEPLKMYELGQECVCK